MIKNRVDVVTGFSKSYHLSAAAPLPTVITNMIKQRKLPLLILVSSACQESLSTDSSCKEALKKLCNGLPSESLRGTAKRDS